MLENITAEKMVELRLIGGNFVEEVDISTLVSGVIVRVVTKGNCYLLEITNPEQYRAHVVRCDLGSLGISGYQGDLVVTPKFSIGDRILLGAILTSRVELITILL